MNKITKIEIDFPVPVEAPPGFWRALDTFIGLICAKYEAENPGRVIGMQELTFIVKGK